MSGCQHMEPQCCGHANHDGSCCNNPVPGQCMGCEECQPEQEQPVTTPTRDRVREAERILDARVDALCLMYPYWTHDQTSTKWQDQVRATEEYRAAKRAYRDALLDAVDEDVANVASKRRAVFGADRFIHLDAVRAAIRARKETT